MFARWAASSFYLPVGTCRMGSDAGAVVDGSLSVRGIDGLKIIDASIIPEIPNAIPSAAVIAIAERAAERILTGRRDFQRSSLAASIPL